MIENADLLRQIAQYAGAINRHHNRAEHRPGDAVRRTRSSGVDSGRPFPRSLDRRGRLGSKNRTLVFSRVAELDDSRRRDSDSAEQWISGRDGGHRTLTNAAVYDTATATKLARIEETRSARRRAKLVRRERKDAERLRHLISTTLEHEGVTYKINKKGSLLIRLTLHDVKERPTPKRTTISGVEFLKSPKSDNLFRKSVVKLMSRRRPARQTTKHCKFFTRTGTCKNGSSCPYQHELTHLALCPHYLAPQGCDAKRGCTLSHVPTLFNTPTCTHFHKGSCSKEHCRYAHVHVSPDAAVCAAFAKNGFCSQGGDCPELHIRECPDFRSHGTCSIANCRLPHVIRANKLAPRPKAPAEPDGDSDDSDSGSSFDEYESEDFDEHAFGEYVSL